MLWLGLKEKKIAFLSRKTEMQRTVSQLASKRDRHGKNRSELIQALGIFPEGHDLSSCDLDMCRAPSWTLRQVLKFLLISEEKLNLKISCLTNI